MNYLVTGGSGFIGSNFLNKYVPLNPTINFINVDALTYAGTNKNIEIQHLKNYQFIKADITNENEIKKIMCEFKPTKIIHFAAESHVDQSISTPKKFIQTNILGTFNLLESAKEIWQENYNGKRFHHISTDEVYGSLGKSGYFTESTPYHPRSPYSASKASSDHIVQAYYHTFGLPISISNCSNNYGKNQHEEKMIPTIIRNAVNKKKIPVYGDGKNVRDWLFVEDHCDAIWEIITNPTTIGKTYNIGGKNDISNWKLVTHILTKLAEKSGISIDNLIDLVTFVEDRKGHDFRYAIDSTKIETELGFFPKYNFEDGLEITIDYYLKKYNVK